MNVLGRLGARNDHTVPASLRLSRLSALFIKAVSGPAITVNCYWLRAWRSAMVTTTHSAEIADLSPEQARELLRRHGNDRAKFREKLRTSRRRDRRCVQQRTCKGDKQRRTNVARSVNPSRSRTGRMRQVQPLGRASWNDRNGADSTDSLRPSKCGSGSPLRSKGGWM